MTAICPRCCEAVVEAEAATYRARLWHVACLKAEYPVSLEVKHLETLRDLAHEERPQEEKDALLWAWAKLRTAVPVLP